MSGGSGANDVQRVMQDVRLRTAVKQNGCIESSSLAAAVVSRIPRPALGAQPRQMPPPPSSGGYPIHSSVDSAFSYFPAPQLLEH
jgi:hypothetical protein